VTERVVGRLEAISIYPVRSLPGTNLPAVEIGSGGLAGDRAWTVVDEDERPVRAKETPALRSVRPSGHPQADAAALTAVLGRPVRLTPTPRGAGDVAAVHLVSQAAITRAAAGDVPEGCSADDPRANLLLSLTADDDERSWTGRLLRIGDAVLQITRPPKHCLGVYADVVTPGEVHVGNPVLL
jgi:uncharacterized protein YcbX